MLTRAHFLTVLKSMLQNKKCIQVVQNNIKYHQLEVLTVNTLVQQQTGLTLARSTLAYFFVTRCRTCNKMVHNIHNPYKFIQTLQ